MFRHQFEGGAEDAFPDTLEGVEQREDPHGSAPETGEERVCKKD